MFGAGVRESSVMVAPGLTKHLLGIYWASLQGVPRINALGTCSRYPGRIEQ